MNCFENYNVTLMVVTPTNLYIFVYGLSPLRKAVSTLAKLLNEKPRDSVIDIWCNLLWPCDRNLKVPCVMYCTTQGSKGKNSTDASTNDSTRSYAGIFAQKMPPL